MYHRVLEVGALKPNNFASCSSWLDVTCIDLHSRHPLIQEQDFLLLNETENREQWDLVSLSLVVNFVPEPKDRGWSPTDIQTSIRIAELFKGQMLRLAHAILRPNQYLFLAVSVTPWVIVLLTHRVLSCHCHAS